MESQKQISQGQKERVLITGVTGFLGNHVCKAYIEDGTYLVRGSTTNPKNKQKVEGIQMALGNRFKDLELVQLNLTDENSVETAVQGCQYIVHVASPVPASLPTKKDEEKLIKTAVDGTLSILKAAHKHKVKRVVLTSSTAAVIDKSQ